MLQRDHCYKSLQGSGTLGMTSACSPTGIRCLLSEVRFHWLLHCKLIGANLSIVWRLPASCRVRSERFHLMGRGEGSVRPAWCFDLSNMMHWQKHNTATVKPHYP
jgi:hypothetical protein